MKKNLIKVVSVGVVAIASICCFAVGTNGLNLSDLISNSIDASAKQCWYSYCENDCTSFLTIGCAPCPDAGGGGGGGGGDEECPY